MERVLSNKNETDREQKERIKHLENDVTHARDKNEQLKHNLKTNQESEADKVRTELNIFKALVLQKFESMEEMNLVPKESEIEKKTKKNFTNSEIF